MTKPFHQKRAAGLDVIEVPGDPEGVTILMLHGYGANAFDLLPLYQIYKESPRPTWLFPHAPLEVPIQPGYVGKAWFPIDMEALKMAYYENKPDAASFAFPFDLADPREIVEALLSELNITRSKLVLGGFSQGAILATDLLLHAQEKSKGLLIFSGSLINEEVWTERAATHAGTPFFQSHGIEDPLLPLKRAKDLEELLLKKGLRGQLHLFHGGHEIPQTTLLQARQFLLKILGSN